MLGESLFAVVGQIKEAMQFPRVTTLRNETATR